MVPGDLSGAIQRDRPALGSTDDRPSLLDRGARPRFAWDDELMRHLDVGFEVAQERVEARDHLGRYARAAVLEPVPRVRIRGELRAGDEQLALQPEDQLTHPGQAGRDRVELTLQPKFGSRRAKSR